MKRNGFTRKIASVFLILLLLFLLGCGGKKAKGLKTTEGDPEVLYKQGLVLLNNKHYREAFEKFELLKSNFPDSPPFTILAEMKVGDCHYHLKEYAEAIASYEEFKKVHPTYEEMPYIQFQLGMCYFSQMTTADRDQTSTQKAMANFEYLIANYPLNLFT